ncbi:DUF192 domain-containing protein [Marinithermus hydrothermalis]|uniref:DUF192 domain-containing protein n=1 Tax=Marinithermus hydrothermalis (strain DSM 14884 / JCM 11576 / T1) TaxID=869210 RepID=F2NM33_MARHT|nr:DUF192 domain-containing protein [Marinithermus hydrothermalis]AEB11503.1 protein of unknown function DUF192 [Marinithermus hydrothermalis DSM 14884]
MARLKWLLIGMLSFLGAYGYFVAFQLQSRVPPGPKFPEGTLLVVTSERTLELVVEIADTPERWARGLMFRDSLPEDRGMVFLFPRTTDTGFWMKNTRIPLSIAFFDGEGVILRIMDMEPCLADPCPVYTPGVAYRGALEVNQGWFERHGVREGDYVSLVSVPPR